MKSLNKRSGGKTGAVVALCIVLVVTILLGWIGLTGMSIPPRGLYKVLSWLPTTNADNWPESLSLGLDLRGGMYVEYSGKAPEGSEASFDDLMEGTMSIIRSRLADKNYTEANVQRIGVDGIRVEIPDVQDDSVLDLIGATAEMRFLDPDGNEIMKGDKVKRAVYSYQDGKHVIAFELTDEGRALFADATSKNVGRNIKITLDDEVLVDATVNEAINDGRGIISGNYTQESALTTAAQIQSGALPLELTQQKVDKVSATLGQNALSSSVLAAFIGIVLIMLLMIFRYRLNGVIASWALALYIIILFMLIALFRIHHVCCPGRQRNHPDRRHRAPDLRYRLHPGLRQDPAAGRGRLHAECHPDHPLPDEPLRERGCHQYFALYESERRKGGRAVMVIKNRSRICLIISAAIILIALVLTLCGRGVNLGIDFEGGLSMQYDLKTAADKTDVDTVLSGMDISSYTVTVQGANDNEINIRIKDVAKDDIQKVQADFEAGIKEKYADAESIGDVNYVGPVAGATLVKNAIISVLLAAVLMLIYIAIRFDFNSGVSAVFGLLHDVLIMLSFMVIFRSVIQMNSSFIAAALTIVGYSINNTIVIFDRIRENAKKMTAAPKEEVTNISIRESLGRTICTTVTTLITIVALCILGVASIREFALPIIVGILSGVYSANMINGYVWAFLEEKRKSRKAKAKA